MHHFTTIAAQLEHDRLLRRVARLEQVLDALHDRSLYRNAVTGEVPVPLQRAIADFASELDRVRTRLETVGREPAARDAAWA